MPAAADKIVCRLRHLSQPHADLTDAELLARFIADHDQDAFDAIVRRHGPMVLGVCRRILGGSADADDAYQATFLVLVRRAACVQPARLLGNWLHGVAVRTAMKMRTMAARRRARELSAPVRQTNQEVAASDLAPVVDQELARLPDDYRAAVVLCDLEGRSYRAAAHALGWPEGTLATRLRRARAILAQRLARRGVVPVAGLAAAAATEALAAAAVRPALGASAIWHAHATARIAPRVAALARAVEAAMASSSQKVAGTALIAVLVLALGAGHVAPGLSRAPTDAPLPPEVAAQAPADQPTENARSLDQKLAEWTAAVQKKLEADPAGKELLAKYPLVLIHSRHHFGARDGGYRRSAFSFTSETSDPARHRNNVQILYHNGRDEGDRFDYNMVVDQRNLVIDLGKSTFAEDPTPHLRRVLARVKFGQTDELFHASIDAVPGHVYLMRVRDPEHDFDVLFQVVAVGPGNQYMAFVWRKLPIRPSALE